MQMIDPFKFSEDDKIIILLARSFYLSACVYKSERPNPDPLYTGQVVLRKNAAAAVDLLGFDDQAMQRLIDENNRLYKLACDTHAASTSTAVA